MTPTAPTNSTPGADGRLAAFLAATRCAICDTLADAREIHPANFNPADLNPRIFSARRPPDRLHFRMVRCRACGLVRSDPVAPAPLLESLYIESSFDYAAEAANLRATYGRYLKRARRHTASADDLLEIGCGNGFFLEEARAQGFRSVWGVEPSRAACAAAPPALRPRIVRAMMRTGLFPPSSFDVICLFQVFDHVARPKELAQECRRLLRAGGVVLTLNHNVEALSARLLGERSPIIDVEHTFLYSPATLAQVFQRAGFDVVESGAAWNTYGLNYLVHLLPLPTRAKQAVLWAARRAQVGRLRLCLPLGNLYQVARKPAV